MVRGVYLVLAALAVVGVASQNIDPACGECDKSKCPAQEDCPGAQAMDMCNCCSVCRRSLGQRCDLSPATGVVFGPCEPLLVCSPRVDITGTNEATCECKHQSEVCGSDNRTYPTVCDLLQEVKVQENRELTVQRQGPCLMKPVIKTAPQDSKRALGGILVLDCEAVGVPVPTISWELLKPNGVSVKLPNDDSGVAVQIRGGPEQHMITAWVQIMKVSQANVGTYVCKAQNSEGEAMATAEITYSEKDNEIL